MPRLGPQMNCMRIFKKTQAKGLSKLLLGKKKCPISSVDLKSQLRQSNSYLQTTVIAQCKRTMHPRRGPQMLLRVQDQGDGIHKINVVLQGPGVIGYPENTIGSPLYILDCKPELNPWGEDSTTSHQCCLIVRMPLDADEEQIYLVNDGAAEAQEKTVGSKRRALPASEEEREEGEGEEEEGGNPRRAPSGKRLKQAKSSVRSTEEEGDLVLSVEVAHPSAQADRNQGVGAGPSTTHPPPSRTTQQDESAAVGTSVQLALSPSHQTRTIACQASPRASKSSGYHYTKLKDLNETALKNNVFGVVKTFSQPRKSKGGTDVFSSSRLVDETGEVQCTLFCQELERLPKIENIGDIVRLHRVGVSTYQGNIQIIGRKIFSCLTFDGCPGQPVVPRTNATEFTFTSEDQKRIEELRAWAATQPALNAKERQCVLEKVTPGLYFDIVCQVISTCLIAANECAVVRVWDGTKVAMNARSADRYGHPSNADSNLEELIQDLSVDITLYNDHMDAVRNILPGQFIRLNNVHAACHLVGRDNTEVVDLCIHRGRQYSSGVTVLPMGTPEVEALKPKLSAILEQRMRLFRRDDIHQPRVQQTSATVCPGHREQFDTIEDVLSCPKVPNKHRMRVKFVRLFGRSLEECVKLVCTDCQQSNFPMRQSFSDGGESSRSGKWFGEDDICPNCFKKSEKQNQLKFLYRMKMEIADHTGKMTVLLGDDNADTFFPGLPPSNLHLNLATRDQLYLRLRQLSAGEDIFVTPRGAGKERHHMECCVVSYYIGGSQKGKAAGKVAYRIFDTILEAGNEV